MDITRQLSEIYTVYENMMLKSIIFWLISLQSRTHEVYKASQQYRKVKSREKKSLKQNVYIFSQ